MPRSRCRPRRVAAPGPRWPWLSQHQPAADEHDRDAHDLARSDHAGPTEHPTGPARWGGTKLSKSCLPRKPAPCQFSLCTVWGFCVRRGGFHNMARRTEGVKVTTADGESRWLTSEESAQVIAKLRGQLGRVRRADAIELAHQILDKPKGVWMAGQWSACPDQRSQRQPLCVSGPGRGHRSDRVA